MVTLCSRWFSIGEFDFFKIKLKWFIQCNSLFRHEVTQEQLS